MKNEIKNLGKQILTITEKLKNIKRGAEVALIPMAGEWECDGSVPCPECILKEIKETSEHLITEIEELGNTTIGEDILEECSRGEVVYKKMVMTEDLNPSGALFGGRMLNWIDEAAAIFALELKPDKRFVTLKVSEVLFEHPARLGDILTFYTKLSRVGQTSLGMSIKVMRQEDEIVTCEVTFVSVDENGRPTPHELDLDKLVP